MGANGTCQEAGRLSGKYPCRATPALETALNCPEPVITHDFSNEYVIQLDIDTVPITHDEVKRAINSLKNGKATRIDGIQAELIKAGGETMVATLTELCNKVWNTETVPANWKDSVIVPLPKKWRSFRLLVLERDCFIIDTW